MPFEASKFTGQIGYEIHNRELLLQLRFKNHFLNNCLHFHDLTSAIYHQMEIEFEYE